MGSGFLVSVPLLAGIVGNLAVVCMAILLVLAFAVGEAIRFNIQHFEPINSRRRYTLKGPGAVRANGVTQRRNRVPLEKL